MPKIVQEKLQIHYPTYNTSEVDDPGPWVSDNSARAKKGMPGREGYKGGDNASKKMNNAAMFHSLPPGMDIEDQEVTDQRRFNMSIAGNFSVGHNSGDLTQELTAANLVTGYSKKRILATDDEYSLEHEDTFYLDVGGFAERGNTLDRL